MSGPSWSERLLGGLKRTSERLGENLSGLTGKWVGAKGGGNFSEDAGSGKDNKHYFVCFDGSYDMKR